ncbi:tRNA pseudouridine38-40 synthase [Algoriphagus boseongensis]|uniref:tRNA pseudouridine synthase A n=1 Tax=Algoriphagus boseongensis TaxID=1442587 RepID=A0A4R6T1V5_9BACT|nr:tRNA pseudouridine(38-40) synthase TruA [Algoriphagus boseongensis]TDQ14952.1 tRNA pseudouridine38-40 synthase [Algoriphagus boseongensis]
MNTKNPLLSRGIESELYLCSPMQVTRRYFLELSYKGTPFHGWQIQQNAFTVQECLEKGLSTFFRQPIAIMGSGRTDTGVHASMQVCHFDLVDQIPSENFLKGINAILPKEIAIHSIRLVKPDAHARFDAKNRSYFYRIIFQKNPFLDDLAWLIFHNPDIEKMNQAAKILLGHEDFECFSKVHTEVNHFRCKIYSAHWEQKDGQLLFHITANRFLRGMVRAIVGTLMEIGLGTRSIESMEELILSKDRTKAGKAAPAKGLFLCNINYPTTIYLD